MYIILLVEYVFFAILGYVMRFRKNNVILFSITVIALSITMSFVQPNSTMDLYRYYDWLEQYRLNGWEYVTSQYYFQYSPLYPIYFFAISKIGHNYWLAFITTFLDFSLLFRVLIKARNKFNMSPDAVYISYLSILLYIDLLNVTGIRSMLASVLVTVALYEDVYEKRKNAILFYVVGALLHTSVILVLALRIMTAFFRVLLERKLMLLIAFLMSITSIMLIEKIAFALYAETGIGFFYVLAYQVQGYMQSKQSLGNTHFVYEIASVVRILCMYLDVVQKNKEKDPAILIPLYMAVISLGLSSFSVVSIRYMIMANVVSLPYTWRVLTAIKIVTKGENDARYTSFKKISLKKIVVLMFLIQLAYLWYYQYPQFGLAL